MKKFICIVVLAFLIATPNAFSQNTLTKYLELKMPGTSGTNGAAIAWHPEKKRYYAAFAGNSSFPLGVFNSAGKLISDPELTAMIDVRGLWYNSLTKGIEGNGYGETGWFELILNAEGMPEGADVIFEGENQPDANSVGIFADEVEIVAFFSSSGNVVSYSRIDAEYETSVSLELGKTRAGSAGENADVVDQYNYTGLMIDLEKAELGLLNVDKRQIEMYNPETGLIIRTIKIPSDAPLSKAFNFSYTNKVFWFFDTQKRSWIGYR